MSNYSSQDHQSWPGRSMRDDNFSRSNRDQDQGNWQRRNWPQEGQQGHNMGGGQYSPYGSEQQDSYEQGGRQNMSSRGGRGQHRGEPWPRNEDRENYSSVADYGRPDQYFDRSSNRAYSASDEYGQGYGGQGQGYYSEQEQARNRGSSFNQSSFNQSQSPFSGGQDNYENQSRYGFQQGRGNDWNSGAGYPQGTQSWQEREGAQRGAFGLQSSHRGKGPQGYSRSDERIKEDVCERLSEHHFIDASSINVEVEQGVVTLEGSVPDRWQKYQTEDLVDAISGVKDIHNRLTVSRNNQQSSQTGMQQGSQGMQSQGAQQGTQQQGGNQQQSAAQKTSQNETRDKERTKSATTNQTGNS
jgi:osmotically-inducible protein OsmY